MQACRKNEEEEVLKPFNFILDILIEFYPKFFFFMLLPKEILNLLNRETNFEMKKSTG